MIILIPIGGTGQRFRINGYKKPKALIHVDNKEIIFHLLDNLSVNTEVGYIYIPYNKEYCEYNFETVIRERYPTYKFKFLKLEKNTRGAAETINIALNHLISNQISYPFGYEDMRNGFDKPILCIDADNFYTCDIIKLWNGGNTVFTVNDDLSNPIYSYTRLNDDDRVVEIKEKVKISDNACTGAYGFDSYYNLFKYTSQLIRSKKTQKGEFYTSGVISEMIADGIHFKNINLENKYYTSLGTPELVNEYLHPFIFDLDGTLVNTDHVYTRVWNTIMKKYQLSIDEKFFNHFIRGKNDTSFLTHMFPNITKDDLKAISLEKDNLFIQYLKEDNRDIFVPGAYEFIKQNKNRRMGIVTSCNKMSAEFIINITGLKDYITFLIASEDCVHHKPHKEPYSRAITYLNCDKKSVTIFEDSNSGYKSALSLGCGRIILIINDKSSKDILNSREHKIKSYKNFSYDCSPNKGVKIYDLRKYINDIPIEDVVYNDVDMKTGYICDIKSVSLLLSDGTTENVVLKIENTGNELSNVARNIYLYKNESIFYKKYSQIINVNIPKFYSAFLDDDKNIIVLENLHRYKGRFNIDLNENIDILISVVNAIVKMHNRFYFKNNTNVLHSMKSLHNIKDITYYKTLVNDRFNDFINNNKILLTESEVSILTNIYNNYENLINLAGSYPLNFCHGDLKSPNIFYKDNVTPYFLDWQYIHLNKGISDIVFLLVESTDFDPIINNIVINYYYKTSVMYNSYEEFIHDFKIALCIFPFFVMVWFNSENRDNLLDKVFPINFMKNTLKFYNHYLDESFFCNNFSNLSK